MKLQQGMNNQPAFGSKFEINKYCIKQFNNHGGSSAGALRRQLESFAHRSCGKDDTFVLNNKSKLLDGPLFPAKITYKPSPETKNMKEFSVTIKEKGGDLELQIAKFMQKMQRQWLKYNK